MGNDFMLNNHKLLIYPEKKNEVLHQYYVHCYVYINEQIYLIFI